MISIRPPFLRCVAVLCCLALPLTSGCNSSSASSPSQPPTSKLDFYNTAVTVVNDTSQCAWITVWWSSHDISDWHRMNGPTTEPRFVEAGKRHVFGYTLVPKVSELIGGALQIQVAADVKTGPGCNDTNIVYRYDNNKSMHPIGQDANVCSHLIAMHGSYFVTKPEIKKNC